MTATIDTVEDLQEAVREGPRVLPVAGGTKVALSTPPTADTIALDVSGLRGIVDYDPAELTVTALAGTPVAELQDALGEHGQQLPFDPPFAAAGATLGGTVAAGASGPCALGHGGVRDFVIGVRFVEGTGRLVSGGGRVVKNAAGFDLPKLMVGSMGRLGVIVGLSFKVFPRPRARTTLVFDLGDLDSALAAVATLVGGPIAMEALDVEPGGRLLVRLGGDPMTLPPRAARVDAAVGAISTRLDGDADQAAWYEAAELTWAPPDSRLVRVALTARDAPGLCHALPGVPMRFSLAVNVAWVAWPMQRTLDELDAALRALGLAGMALTGAPGRTLLGTIRGGAFAARVRRAIDPHERFLEA